jgi:hypothetical protein
MYFSPLGLPELSVANSRTIASVSEGNIFITASRRPVGEEYHVMLPVKAGLCTLSIRTIDNFYSAPQNDI